MLKNPHQNVGIGDSIFQNFSGEHALDPARGSRAFSVMSHDTPMSQTDKG